MLLGDGSPTRHLRLLTGSPVAVDLIAMEADQTDHPGAPKEVKELMAPLLRRQVWLTCGAAVVPSIPSPLSVPRGLSLIHI